MSVAVNARCHAGSTVFASIGTGRAARYTYAATPKPAYIHTSAGELAGRHTGSGADGSTCHMRGSGRQLSKRFRVAARKVPARAPRPMNAGMRYPR